MEYVPLAGEHVQTSAKIMVRIANEKKRTVIAKFNDVQLIAEPGDDPAYIVRCFDRNSKWRDEAYRNSPEGKRAAAETEENRQALQGLADRLMVELQNLDFGNLDHVLDWLCRMEEPRDTKGVSVDIEKIQAVFAHNGFTPGMNCGDDFNADNPVNFAAWIIGQAIQVPSPPLIIHFTEQWHARFKA